MADSGVNPRYTFVIAGLRVRVFGLSALPQVSRDGVAVLFLVHGRMGTQEDMRETAELATAADAGSAGKLPLIVAIFDARNHGDRLVEEKRNANLADNPTHPVDMVSTVVGTAQDVALLVDFLPAVLFPRGEHAVARWAIAGHSLGGHIAWHAAARDVRLTHLAPMNGSPSILQLYAHRGATIPQTLGTLLRYTDADQLPPPLWEGRHILVIAADEDELVPFVEGGSQAFLESLSHVARTELFVQAKMGHKYTPKMRAQLLGWVDREVRRVGA